MASVDDGGLHNYLVHGLSDDADNPNLDWIITAHTPEEAIQMWRAYLIEHDWMGADEAAETEPETVSLLPAVASFPRVHEWSELHVYGSGKGA
jgi:hypothetical protein